MADPFSIGTGVVSLVALVASALQKCYVYGAAVTRASKETKALANALAELNSVLIGLQALESRIRSISNETKINDLTRDCEAAVENVIKRLELDAPNENQDRIRLNMNRAIWPLKQKEILAMVNLIERQKTNIVIQLGVMTNTSLLDQQPYFDSIVEMLSRSSLDADKSSSSQRRKKQFQWLGGYDHEDKHRRALGLVHPGTCQWIFKTDEFESWLSSDSQVLWLNGISGCGKTVLCASIVQRLQEEAYTSDRAVVYFYCDASEKSSQELSTILGSTLHQIWLRSAKVIPEIETAFDKCENASGDYSKPNLAQMEEFLSAATNPYEKTGIDLIIDGLDESKDVIATTHLLQRIAASNEPRIRLLVLSRPLEELKTEFNKTKQCAIRGAEHSQDIDCFIQATIDTLPRLQRLNVGFREHLGEVLKGKSQGMFRWAQCQLDQISKLRTINAIEDALDSLPASLEDTYDRIISRISKSDKPMAFNALQWLTAAPGAMTLDGLAEASTLTKFSGQELTQLDIGARLFNPSDILEILGPLVVHDGKTNMVVLAHHSVRTFLKEERSSFLEFRMPRIETHYKVAIISLNYLRALLKKIMNLRNPQRKWLPQHPLALYAAMYWPWHALQSQREKELLPSIHDFLNATPTMLFNFWLSILRTTDPQHFYMPGRWSRQDNPLYHIISHGLIETTKAILDSGANVNQRGGSHGGTLLHAACWTRRPSILELLLDRGADSCVRDSYNETAYDLCEQLRDKELRQIFKDHDKLPPTLPLRNCYRCRNQFRCLIDHSRKSNERFSVPTGTFASSCAASSSSPVVELSNKSSDGEDEKAPSWTCCECSSLTEYAPPVNICISCQHLQCLGCISIGDT